MLPPLLLFECLPTKRLSTRTYRSTTALATLGDYNLAICISRLVENSESVGKLWNNEVEMSQSMISNNILRHWVDRSSWDVHKWTKREWYSRNPWYFRPWSHLGPETHRLADFNHETEQKVTRRRAAFQRPEWTRLHQWNWKKLWSPFLTRCCLKSDCELSFRRQQIKSARRIVRADLDSCPLLLPGRYN